MSFPCVKSSVASAAKDRSRTIEVQNNQVIKAGITLYNHEVNNMRFIAEHTTIPVPKVHKVETDKDGKVLKIYMDYMPGTSLDEAWSTMTEAEKRSVANDLCNYIHQMRSLKGVYIGAADRGQAVIGQHVFHEVLQVISKVPDIFKYHAAKVFKENHEIVFTHSDLAPRNILVRDGHVTGILDWEHAGWYPEYWEYERAYRHFNDVSGWLDYVDIFLPRKYSEEIVAMSYLSKYSR
ncbi:hypothetical protein ASPBRDRAFT_51463 [Aspergillus brasiliensis CBS 101740]|uniref:non-specific serine/threonine protein kinase n=1 Tax=Aspergillus brasiliensis (strain CBS 101740 / IMI 381727 / IBT 21946) TaxID=767769 RepID=A0A1L9UVK6_ASPBC|nr:hypothetical protein ASPBRDRAFT_51463 [Aspergillus brasiliensis CBS 101740]